MDNLTHTLAGLALGRTLDRRPSAASAASVWTGIVASNLPDVDSVAGLAGKIEYLVHHRGWTHTAVLLPVMAAAAVAIVAVFRKLALREAIPDRTGLARLYGIAAASIALHVSMDWMNNYGVHPFAPFWSGWLYGDSVFIVEPLLWWSLIPLAAAQSASQRRRIAWYGVGTIAVAALALIGGPHEAIAVALLAAALIRLQRRSPGVASAWIAAGCVVATFVVASQLVRVRAAGAVPEQVLDVVRTPGPSNPLCWRVQTVGRDGADVIAREGFVSLAPWITDASSCSPLAVEERSAPLEFSPLASSEAITWTGELRYPVAELRAQSEDCRIAALLTFVRVPFWTTRGHRAVFGDLRYDFGPKESFGEVRLDNAMKEGCPGSPWTPPRADLLHD